jgi:hypothetical protein
MNSNISSYPSRINRSRFPNTVNFSSRKNSSIRNRSRSPIRNERKLLRELELQKKEISLLQKEKELALQERELIVRERELILSKPEKQTEKQNETKKISSNFITKNLIEVCNRNNCSQNCGFAHSEEELKFKQLRYKTVMCSNLNCTRGNYCGFAHSREELRPKPNKLIDNKNLIEVCNNKRKLNSTNISSTINDDGQPLSHKKCLWNKDEKDKKIMNLLALHKNKEKIKVDEIKNKEKIVLILNLEFGQFELNITVPSN